MSDVSVRVVALQISAAIDAPDVRVRVVYDQTEAGIERIAEAKELDALFTTVFVFELTDDAMPAVCVLVFALTFAVSEVMFEARLVEAASTAAFVFALIPDETPAIEEPRDVEAARTLLFAVVIFVFAVLIFALAVASEAPSDVEARSVCALTADVMPEV